MKLMIDDAVWGYKEIFSGFGEITTLPGRLITQREFIRLRDTYCQIKNQSKQTAP